MTRSTVPQHVEHLLARLYQVIPRGTGWRALCPAHGDRNPSLDIDVSEDGKILLCCRSQQCSAESVVAAIGLRMADLFAGDHQRHNGHVGVPARCRDGAPMTLDQVLAACGRTGHVAGYWVYTDGAGLPVLLVVRIQLIGAAKTFRQLRAVGDCWAWGAPKDALPLFRLQGLLRDTDREVLIAEGEKKVDALVGLGFLATTSAGGARATSKTCWVTLAGRNVAILADHDEPGLAYARAVAGILMRLAPAARVRIVAVPELLLSGEQSGDLRPGDDIADLVARRRARGLGDADIADQLAERIGAAECLVEPPASPKATVLEASAIPADGDDDDHDAVQPDRPRTSRATELVKLATKECELFHDAAGTGYADMMVGGHRETWLLANPAFKRWLAMLHFQRDGAAPSSSALADALNVLSGHASYSAPQRDVFVRFAPAAAVGEAWLDLADKDWRAVRISSQRWSIEARPTVRFRRPAGMLPLPEPERGGTLQDLMPLLGASTSNTGFVLTISWLVAALLGQPPFPIMVLQGEQGSGKSTRAIVLRRLLDPAKVVLRAQPRDERDLAISAANAGVLGFDNMSCVPEWFSDALCRIATGGGFGCRQLYTDAEEFLFDGTRPILLNGIADLLGRPDLGSRALLFRLPQLSDDQRRTEAAFWSAFGMAHPRLLGALLDLAVEVLATRDGVHLDYMPRMADFAVTGEAVARALGHDVGYFIAAYTDNREELVSTELSADPVAVAVQQLLLQTPGNPSRWLGTPTQLFSVLGGQAQGSVQRSRSWPGSPAALSSRLTRLTPSLRSAGILVETCRTGFARTINLVRL